jgi:hypothetical protein
MDVLSKQAKKDIRQLIIIGRDRETAKFLQQVESMLQCPYQEGETTTDSSSSRMTSP